MNTDNSAADIDTLAYSNRLTFLINIKTIKPSFQNISDNFTEKYRL